MREMPAVWALGVLPFSGTLRCGHAAWQTRDPVCCLTRRVPSCAVQMDFSTLPLVANPPQVVLAREGRAVAGCNGQPVIATNRTHAYAFTPRDRVIFSHLSCTLHPRDRTPCATLFPRIKSIGFGSSGSSNSEKPLNVSPSLTKAMSFRRGSSVGEMDSDVIEGTRYT